MGIPAWAWKTAPSRDAPQTHWGPTYFAHGPAPSVIVLPPGQPAASSVAFAGGWPHKGGADFLEVTPPDAYDHPVIPLSYGTGGGAIHATVMARHTTVYHPGDQSPADVFVQVTVVEPWGRLDRADQLAVLDGVVRAARADLCTGDHAGDRGPAALSVEAGTPSAR